MKRIYIFYFYFLDPILELLYEDKPFIGNDTIMNDFCNLQIITGANSSGKSTYINQIGLIVILCHIGCFVPAEEAIIPLYDRIFTRMGTSDNIEYNASTFSLEMNEIANIMDQLTPNSLILMDELGRGTSPLEGISLCWSICEYLRSQLCHCCFVTHYNQLNKLCELYKNVKLLFTNTEIENGNKGLIFTYKLSETNKCKKEFNYGIEMGKRCGLPNDMIEFAEQYEKTHDNIYNTINCTKTDDNDKKNELLQRLLPLSTCALDMKGLINYLKYLKTKYPKTT